MQLLTNKAVLRGVGCGKYGTIVCHHFLTTVGSLDGLRLVRRRMGRWNASVLRVTRSRKKRYCSTRGWECRSAAFVASGEKWGEEEGRGSFSMRAHVR